MVSPRFRKALGRRPLHRAFILALVLGVAGHIQAAPLEPNAEERAVGRLVENHRLQLRPVMKVDPYLHLVARARAQDLARRNYFAHIDPNGFGPNRLLTLTGYRLPKHYDSTRAGNNIESIAAGTNFKAADAFSAWLKSPGHRTHLLATEPFYREQTRYGVGYAKDPASDFGHYFVFVSAPPSEQALGPLATSVRNLFLTKTAKQIVRSLSK